MTTIKISEIVPLLYKDVCLIDNGDNSLDVEQNDYWSRDTEEEYNNITNKLDKINIKGKGYKIYVWYDVSGFHYWVIKQQEENYAQITISFDNDYINNRQLKALENKIQRCISRVQNIINY